MAEQLHLDLRDRLVPDPVGQHRLDQLADAADQSDGGHGERDEPDGMPVPALDRQPHRRFHPPRQNAGQGADEGCAGHGRGERRQVGLQIVAEDPRHQPPTAFAVQGLGD